MEGYDLAHAKRALEKFDVSYSIWDVNGTQLDGAGPGQLKDEAWSFVRLEPAGNPGSGDEVRLIMEPMVPKPSATAAPTQPAGITISYVITADGPISSTTFGNSLYGKLSTEQANDVSSPFQKDYFFTESQIERGYNTFGVTAQSGEGATTITCQILRNGVQTAKQTSTGPFAVVSCQH
ncbi:hypothetical protein LRQ04_10585 [Paenarthrobacter sp. AR 02]|uniref:hypothetical protein n=1 Tax=Paenarthrobacter sp. AR 02 TaxID=2899821 RepID=UPI001F1803A1|nr:hypothetical protein [Paenarthrobacter sp. AR 02]MCF3139701.1 hypothetical protein [Paenarthrobacter sp. AR 02]